MKVHLEKTIGLTGDSVGKAWTASVYNNYGQIVIAESAVTAQGALREVKRRLEEALRAVDEMIIGK